MSNFNFENEARIQRQKVNYFNSKVGKDDFDNALNYLILADWDEKKAVKIYMAQYSRPNIPPKSNNNQDNRNHQQQNNRNNHQNNNRKIRQPINDRNNQQNNRNIPSQNNNQRNQEPQLPVQERVNEAEFHITEPFLKDKVTHISRDSAPFRDMMTYLRSKFKFVANSLESFSKLLKEHAGIIILLTFDKFDLFKSYVNKIKNDFLSSDIVNNSILFPIMKDSALGGELVNQFSCISFPSFIFCKYKSEKDMKIIGRMEGAFSNVLLNDYLLNSFPESQSSLRSSLRKSLNRSIMNSIRVNDNNNNNNNINNNNNDNFLAHNQDYFYGDPEELERLIANLGNEDNNNSNNNPNNQDNQNNNINNNQNNSINKNVKIKDSIAGLSDGEILAKREREIKELEKQQEEKMRKEEEEKRKIREEENKKKEREEIYIKEAEKSKNLLPPEPEENNPNCCKIILRYPDGDKTMERRFLKTEKVISLYLFVKSKGREIFTEEEYNDFDLIFGFPPKNLENSKNKTFEEEGMFPNAIINIREKE